MKLSQMETLLKRYGFDETDPLKEWLNMAMHEIECDTDWPFLETASPEFVNTAVGNASLTLPSNTLKVITLRDVTHKVKLEFFNYHKFVREVEDQTVKGFPEIYTHDADNQFVKLWPVPDGVYSMEIVAQLETLDMTEVNSEPQTGATIWPLAAQSLIVFRAAAIALMSENEEERAKTAQEQYEKGLDKLRRKFANPNLDENRTVEDVMEYGSLSAVGRFF